MIDPSAPRMTQPEAMKTKTYVYGVETLNGYDAWALFEACAAGDVPKVKALLAKDRRLVNAQFWCQFPIHMAVREGHAQIVKVRLHADRPRLARDVTGFLLANFLLRGGSE